MTKLFSKMSRAEQKSYLKRRRTILTFIILPLTFLFTYLMGCMAFGEILPNVLMFNGKNQEVKFFNADLGLFGVFFPLASFCIALIIGIIKNNINNLKLEIYIMISGAFVFFFFMFFSYPLMMSWAHIHHYHLDHYEPAHKGGWYIFKLNETP